MANTETNNILGSPTILNMSGLNQLDTDEILKSLGALDVTDLINTLDERINDPSFNFSISSKQTFAFLISFFQNTLKLIGPIPRGKSVGQHLSDMLEKLDDTVNANLLLKACINALGVGLYNTADNGMIGELNFDINKKILNFTMGELNAMVVREGNMLIENIGNTTLSLNLSPYINVGNETFVNLRIVIHTDKLNTAELQYLQNLSFDEYPMDEYSHIFAILEDDVQNDIAAYTSLLNQKNTYEVFNMHLHFNEHASPKLIDSIIERTYTPIKPFTYLYYQLLRALNGDGQTLKIPQTWYGDNNELLEGHMAQPFRAVCIESINLEIIEGVINDNAVVYFLPDGCSYAPGVDMEKSYLYKWIYKNAQSRSVLMVNPIYKNRTSLKEALSMEDNMIIYCDHLNTEDNIPPKFYLNVRFQKSVNIGQPTNVIFRLEGISHERGYVYPLNTGALYSDPLYYEESTYYDKPDVVYQTTENHIFGGFSGRSLKDKSIYTSKLADDAITTEKIADKSIRNRHFDWDTEPGIAGINRFRDKLDGDRIVYGDPASTNEIKNRTKFSVFENQRTCITGGGTTTNALCFSWLSNKSLGSIKLSEYTVDHTEQVAEGEMPLAKNRFKRKPNFYSHALLLHKNFGALNHNDEIGFKDIVNREGKEQLATVVYAHKFTSQLIETGGIILSSNPAIDDTNLDAIQKRSDVAIAVHRDSANKDPYVSFFLPGEDDSLANIRAGGYNGGNGNDYVDAYPLEWFSNKNAKFDHGKFYGITVDGEICLHNEHTKPFGFASYSASFIAGNVQIKHFPKAVKGALKIPANSINIKIDSNGIMCMFKALYARIFQKQTIRIQIKQLSVGMYIEPYQKDISPNTNLTTTTERTIHSVGMIISIIEDYVIVDII